MSKNYERISPRGDQRYRRNQSGSRSGYFVLLLLIIIGITCYYVFSRGIFFSHKDNGLIAGATKARAEEKPKQIKPRFEFYTLLSKETVPVHQDKEAKAINHVAADATTTPEELAAEKIVKEKELLEEKQKNALPAVAPTGVPNVPVQTTTHEHKETPKPAATTPVTTTQPTAASTNRYVLQVAALQRVSDIDQLKAKLSFMGFNVITEPFQRMGSTWYRIKVGPFTTTESMQKAREALIHNHMSSITITLPAK